MSVLRTEYLIIMYNAKVLENPELEPGAVHYIQKQNSNLTEELPDLLEQVDQTPLHLINQCYSIVYTQYDLRLFRIFC